MSYGMHRFHGAANTILMGLGNLTGWLCGCAHRRTTFPITLRGSPQSETYVACLDCGRHFAYDWKAMRITGHQHALAEANRELR